jgi:universal stress protein A
MYNRVIVAIDFSESSKQVLQRAIELVDDDIHKLVLAHVVEPIPTVWGMESYAINPIDLQQKIIESSQKTLEQFGSENGIAKADQFTLLGSPATKIRELQEKQSADAIVIGSHGHSGWKMMLGSTAISLLHGATCDVLTVYISED